MIALSIRRKIMGIASKARSPRLIQ